MSKKQNINIDDSKGKLGVLIVGLDGAVSTTFMAGVEMIRKGLKKPYGSLTQMQKIRLGKRPEHRNPLIKDFIPLANLQDLVFGGWDIFDMNAYEGAKKAGVLKLEDLNLVKGFMEGIRPMPGVFNQYYVKKLNGDHIKEWKNKKEMAEEVMEDIKNFKKNNNLDRVLVIWASSTEIYIPPSEVHLSLENFERGLEESHKDISPSMIYAYAALKSGVPFINGAPGLTVDFPAMYELAEKMRVPIAGKDFKTGQTLMKTIIAPGLKARMIGIGGWFSTNILGNRDGEVLDDPESFKSKETSKLSVLDTILQPDTYPELYRNIYHKVRINYYPPRGDNKEGWDNIDIFGWLGYPMQIKIDFLCRDSILAAPVVLDLVLFMDLARRAHLKGIQEWLSFYFKSPMVAPGLYPENDLFIQHAKLKNFLRYLMGEELITHLGVEYYDMF